MKVALCRVEDVPAEGAKVLDFFGRPLLVLTVNGRQRPC